MTYRQQKGLSGERVAAEYLQGRGFRVLERRYRYGRKEIDLVVEKDDLVVFVEVKARSSESYGPIQLSITERKKQNLVEAAEGWLVEREPGDLSRSYRFDVILISRRADGRINLEHIENAFQA